MKRLHLAQKLSLLPQNTINDLSYVIGFDGFVDELSVCVNKRTDAILYEPMQTIHEFAERILEAVGKSTNFELVIKQKKIGGNGPIVALALAAAGVKPFLIGALGYPEIDPLFSPLVEKCAHIFSIATPGYTDAIEFLDGKILLGKQHGILDIGVEALITCVGRQKLIELFDQSRFFITLNWTMVIGMTAIWKYILDEILPCISPMTKKRQLFIDLADPAKRTDQDLRDAFEQLCAFQKFYHVTLSLNELEARRIMQLFDPQHKEKTNVTWLSKDKIANAAEWLRVRTGLNTVVIHATKYAAAANEEECVIVDGPYCEKPLLTTGGGDNFNAGFLLGIGIGSSLEEALLLAVHTSGFYVKEGRSPIKQELIAFLRYQEYCAYTCEC